MSRILDAKRDMDTIKGLEAEIARLQEQVAALSKERDRQYDENVNRITAEGAAILRAEAAEAERDRLREALVDLISWFPDKPSKPEWRLTAGEYGADDAVSAARAALQKEPQP